MDPTHFHLQFVHVSIIGVIFGTVTFIYGLVFKNKSIQTLAMLSFVVVSLISIPVFLTGEEAEETVENLQGVSHDVIHEHEEAAEKAIWLMGTLGAISLITLLAAKGESRSGRTLTIVTLIVALLTSVAFTRVGYLGGQVRHSEIRQDMGQYASPPAATHEEHEDHDD